MEDGWFEARMPEDAEANEVVDIDNQMQVVGDTGAGDTGGAAQQNDDDDVADMDEDLADLDAEMEQMEKNQDDAAATDNIFATEEYKTEQAEEVNTAVKRVRMYDLSITYDYYHRTPRLWLQGYSEDGDLLTQDEMF